MAALCYCISLCMGRGSSILYHKLNRFPPAVAVGSLCLWNNSTYLVQTHTLHARGAVWSFTRPTRAHAVDMKPLCRGRQARRGEALQRYVKQGKLTGCVTRELQSRSSSRPALEKQQHEWILFVRQRRKTKTSDKLFFPLRHCHANQSLPSSINVSAWREKHFPPDSTSHIWLDNFSSPAEKSPWTQSGGIITGGSGA